MHTAEPARRHHLDPDLTGNEHGRGNGGCAKSAVDQQARADRAWCAAYLGSFDELPARDFAQPDIDPSIDHGHGGGHGALIAHRLLDCNRDCAVVRARQPLADPGRFQGDHAVLSGQRVRDPGAVRMPRSIPSKGQVSPSTSFCRTPS